MEGSSLARTARSALGAAWPIMLGYVAIGIPCGIMEQQVGFDVLTAFIVSVTFYSGAGQFMVPGMWMAGQPLLAIAASVSFVNTRQILYSAAFSPHFQHVSRLRTFLFAATVTDESFGVNMQRFQQGEWGSAQATLVNVFSMLSWAAANAVGVAVGNLIDIPTAVAAFAMTSIFICLLATQPKSKANALVAAVSAAGVCAFKAVGLTGPAILLGAACGVAAGIAARKAVAR